MTHLKVYDQHDSFYRATVMGRTYEVGNPQLFVTHIHRVFPELEVKLEIIK